MGAQRGNVRYKIEKRSLVVKSGKKIENLEKEKEENYLHLAKREKDEGSQMRDCEENRTEGDRVKSNLSNNEGYPVPGNCEPFNVNG